MTPRPRKKDAVFVGVPGSEYLELNTKNGIYYVRKYRAGKGELFKSTRSKKKGEAKTIAEDMIASWLGLKGHAHRRIRMEVLANEFLESCKQDHETLDNEGRPLRRLSTYKHDVAFVKLINKLFGEMHADELDEQWWDDWVADTGRKLNRTLGDICKYLSQILGYAVKRKMLSRKPTFRYVDKKKHKVVIYEDAQILLFIKHASPNLKDMIIIGGENPLRPHEIREMRWEFITFEKKTHTAILRLPAWFTKVARDRELVLSPNASAVLYERFKRAGGDVFVFPSPRNPGKPISDVMLSKYWRQMLKRAGISAPIRFHWLRHSVYTKLLLDAHIPVQHVSEAGGTSIRVLQNRYLKSDHTRTRLVSQAISLKLKSEEE